MDQTLENWLDEQFENENTWGSYRTALRRFKKELKIEDLGIYLDSAPNALKDMKLFLKKINNSPPKTQAAYSNAVKLFLEEHGYVIPKREWRQLRRRGKRPRKVRAVTRDKINTKGELRQILNHCHVKSKSLFLFLVSSGARIGEALQLKKEDLELDAKLVPLAHIRGEYTKGGAGGRTVPMSFEAKDAIQDWLGCKDTLRKRSAKGDTYAGDLVWSYAPCSARQMWHIALKKASLDKKDPETNRYIYHIHGLRKFFRSRIGLDREQREIILGHSGYLDEAYLRYTEPDWLKLWEAYAEVVSNVSIYEIESEGLRERVKELEMQQELARQSDKELGKVAQLLVKNKAFRQMMKNLLKEMDEED